MIIPLGKNEEEGFTVAELLVVMLVIGILAAIAVPTFMGQRRAAHEAALKSDLRNVGMQLTETYNWQVGYKTPIAAGGSEEASIDLNYYEPVNLSDGVDIDFRKVPNGFCLSGTHEGDPCNVWTYSSLDGGLSKNHIGCIDGSNTDEDPEDLPEPPEEPGRTGDIFQDEPLTTGCTPEHLEINRAFNEAITTDTPATLMLWRYYDQVNSSWSVYNDYINHPDMPYQNYMFNHLLQMEAIVDNDPVLSEKYQTSNAEIRAIYGEGDAWSERQQYYIYEGVIDDYVTSGGSPYATPTAEIQEAFANYIEYVHQWNYIQCGEYAYPGHPQHRPITSP